MVAKASRETRGVELSAVDAERLTVQVARMYYEREMTHQAIADQLGVSRVKVTRMLAEARRSGIVTITVHDTTRPFAELERELCTRLGVERTRVASAVPGASPELSIALDSAEELADLLCHSNTVAFGVSSTVAHTVAALPSGRNSHAIMVPASGGWAGTDRQLNPDSSAGGAARTLGTRAAAMTAPLIVGTPELAAALAAEPAVADVLREAASAEVLLLGIGVAPGAPEWGDALLGAALTYAETQELRERGCAGDISGRFFDAEGAAIEGVFDSRVVGITLEQMRAVPQRIAFVVGERKIPALRAAIRGGLVSTLVTDQPTADALLGALDKPQSHRSNNNTAPITTPHQ